MGLITEPHGGPGGGGPGGGAPAKRRRTSSSRRGRCPRRTWAAFKAECNLTMYGCPEAREREARQRAKKRRAEQRNIDYLVNIG